jgi:hypothetical protein
MDELQEAAATLENVQSLLDDLVVSGVRSAPAATLAQLRARRDEFAKMGAEHLAESIQRLVACIEADDREAPGAVVRAQTSLRLFERFLSKEAASASLASMLAPEEHDPESAMEESS